MYHHKYGNLHINRNIWKPLETYINKWLVYFMESYIANHSDTSFSACCGACAAHPEKTFRGTAINTMLMKTCRPLAPHGAHVVFHVAFRSVKYLSEVMP